MSKLPLKRVLLSALMVVSGVVLIGVGVVLAVTAISNTWVSPKITVPTPTTPTPTLRLLNFSSTDFTTDQTVQPEADFQFSIRLQNPSDTGAAAYNNVVVHFAITKASATPAATDLSLYYLDTSTWQPIPLSYDAGSNKLVGTFGPPTGFTVPSGYDATTQLKAVFHSPGEYSAEVWAEN